MRLLVDANISKRVVVRLREQGHDVLFISEHNPSASDASILALARNERRVIVTYDKDFGTLVFRDSEAHVGVIFLRTNNENSETQSDLLIHFLSHKKAREIQNHFWVLTDRGCRKAIV